MQNFFTPHDNFKRTTVLLTGDEHHHATRSCRVKPGELIGVSDGCGRRVHARIEVIDTTQVLAVIEKDVSGAGEPDTVITVALSVIKPSRFETAVEKCSELGVRHIVPIVAERCEQSAARRLKIERLRKIALEAAKQSGRSWVPGISSPNSLSDFLRQSNGMIFVASQRAVRSFEETFGHSTDTRTVTLVIGPEGDFTEQEYGIFQKYDAALFSLGGLTLRTETAAIIAASLAVNVVRSDLL